MVKILEGKQDADGLKIGIVVSRFNHFITENCSMARWMGSLATAAEIRI